MISAKPVRQLFLGGALVTFLLLDAFSFQWPTICSRIVSHGLWSGSALWGKNEDAAVEWLGNGFSLQEDQLIGLYVHIPYCRRRCRYCNFAIVPIGIHADTETTELTSAQSGFRELDQKYTNSLLKEFDLLLTNSRDDTIAMKKIPLCSIYVGGGTPSLAPIETLRRIMATILDKNRSPFTINADKCEISIEADPGTFSLQKLQFFKEIGFNRLSLGVQSFDNSILESLGRIHRSEDIVDSIAMIRRVYGDDANYSIDLISGLPGLTLATWLETLEKAVNLEPRPKHLSIYDLQVESVSRAMAL